jgi:hypothetical protein
VSLVYQRIREIRIRSDCRWRPGALQLIFEFPQQVFSPGNAIFFFNAFGRRAVNDAHDPPAEFRLGQDDLDGICRGAENSADLLAHLDRVKHVDRKGILQNDDKGMAGADFQRVFPGRFLRRVWLYYISKPKITIFFFLMMSSDFFMTFLISVFGALNKDRANSRRVAILSGYEMPPL